MNSTHKTADHTTPQNPAASLHIRRAVVETLETRRLLSTTLDGDVLRVLGTPGDDSITVDLADNGAIRVDLNGNATLHDADAFDRIRFDTGNGDDLVSVDPAVSQPTYADLGNGDDTFLGGAGNDAVFGGLGHDALWGGIGDDTLRGEDGNDLLVGDVHDDLLIGHAGDDTLVGGRGDDTLHAGDGNDHADGGAGFDNLTGGDGDDELHGGLAPDFIEGNAGDDLIYSDGPDHWPTARPGDGRLLADGGPGRDTIYGSPFADDLTGETLFEGGEQNLIDLAQTLRPSQTVTIAGPFTDGETYDVNVYSDGRLVARTLGVSFAEGVVEFQAPALVAMVPALEGLGVQMEVVDDDGTMLALTSDSFLVQSDLGQRPAHVRPGEATQRFYATLLATLRDRLQIPDTDAALESLADQLPGDGEANRRRLVQAWDEVVDAFGRVDASIDDLRALASDGSDHLLSMWDRMTGSIVSETNRIVGETIDYWSQPANDAVDWLLAEDMADEGALARTLTSTRRGLTVLGTGMFLLNGGALLIGGTGVLAGGGTLAGSQIIGQARALTAVTTYLTRVTVGGALIGGGARVAVSDDPRDSVDQLFPLAGDGILLGVNKAIPVLVARYSPTKLLSEQGDLALETYDILNELLKPFKNVFADGLGDGGVLGTFEPGQDDSDGNNDTDDSDGDSDGDADDAGDSGDDDSGGEDRSFGDELAARGLLGTWGGDIDFTERHLHPGLGTTQYLARIDGQIFLGIYADDILFDGQANLLTTRFTVTGISGEPGAPVPADSFSDNTVQYDIRPNTLEHGDLTVGLSTFDADGQPFEDGPRLIGYAFVPVTLVETTTIASSGETIVTESESDLFFSFQPRVIDGQLLLGIDSVTLDGVYEASGTATLTHVVL